MRKNFKFMTTMLSLVFCLSAIAFGQESTGSIEGLVDAQLLEVRQGASISVRTSRSTIASASRLNASRSPGCMMPSSASLAA